MCDLLDFERQAWGQNYNLVAGIDEAGRGPLAGPVAAAAVILHRDKLQNSELDGLTDSKKLTPRRREFFYQLLMNSDIADAGVGLCEHDEIDRINILKATHRAMAGAVAALPVPPDCILVDGLPVPGLPCHSQAIVKGDQQSLSIAAASVVAKVTRDKIMVKMHEQYPQYGFDRHKGYPSKQHIQALYEHGPCPIHRMSFRPVKEIGNTRDWTESNDGNPQKANI